MADDNRRGFEGELSNKIINLSVILGTLNASFREFDSVQKQALSIGSSTNKALGQLEGVAKSMPGGIAEATKTLVEAQVAGLKGSTRETLLLATQMKLTGQNAGLLMTTLVATQKMGGATNLELSNLSQKTLALSQTFGIQSEVLIKAMNGLSNRMLQFGALNIGPQMMEAVAGLTAGVGPGLEKTLTSFTNTLTGTSLENMVDVMKLGGQRFRNELGKNPSTLLLFQAAKQMGDRSTELTNAITGGMSDKFTALGIQMGVFGGEFGLQGAAITKAIQVSADLEGMSTEAYLRKLDETNAFNTEFNQTMNALIKELLDPLKKLALGWFPPLVRGLTAILPILKIIMFQLIANQFGKQLARFGGFLGKSATALTSVGLKIGLLGTWVMRFAGPIGLALSFLPQILDIFKWIKGDKEIENEERRADKAKEGLSTLDDPTSFLRLSQLSLEDAMKAAVAREATGEGRDDSNNLNRIAEAVEAMDEALNRVGASNNQRIQNL